MFWETFYACMHLYRISSLCFKVTLEQLRRNGTSQSPNPGPDISKLLHPENPGMYILIYIKHLGII